MQKLIHLGKEKQVYQKTIFAFAILILLSIGFAFLFIQKRNISEGPSFIEDLRQGTITEKQIKEIQILRLKSGRGWSTNEIDHLRNERVVLKSRELKTELISILNNHTSDGRTYRNHPSSLYSGIFKIQLHDCNLYYIFYKLGLYKKKYFTWLKVGSEGNLNPNNAKQYENVQLASFLKRNDPWYKQN